ncbi:4-carboxymuconolactone decarboxylase [Nocardia sp. NBC_01377]|uniref:4-carboxymuconolactone decarboxylase n=1 Tax=Nocardia sp. NBC_01377 TaxID=2903595 RepID=UPI0032568816
MNLLAPGSHRAVGIADDQALLGAMLRVETAWLYALVEVGVATSVQADAVGSAAEGWCVDLGSLIVDSEAAGNPVVALVTGLRSAIEDTGAAALVHRGLTSQDVLDTALVLIARDALNQVYGDLHATARALAGLACLHRNTVMPGRTLGRYAVPITVGLKAAQWLSAVLDALELVERSRDRLPAQCGGAAGTLALVGELTEQPLAAAAAFARVLGLADRGVPWHTTRTPITGIGHACVTTCDALGVLAADLLLLSRPEVGELHEARVAGRGGSSTMPHKQNPILAVLVRSAALRAPQLGAQLHLAAAEAVDERPDGAWHSEWSALRDLLELTVTAASQAVELVTGLEVDTDTIARHVAENADDLLAERGPGGGDPATYIGSAHVFVDRVLDRFAAAADKEHLVTDPYDTGMSIRRQVLGDAHVDRAEAAKSPFTQDFQSLITRYAWGEIWARPGLDRRTRSAITLTALLANGHWSEFEMHVRAARRNGMSAEEIAEVILQSAIYLGVPVANHGFALAAQVLAEPTDSTT